MLLLSPWQLCGGSGSGSPSRDDQEQCCCWAQWDWRNINHNLGIMAVCHSSRLTVGGWHLLGSAIPLQGTGTARSRVGMQVVDTMCPETLFSQQSTWEQCCHPFTSLYYAISLPAVAGRSLGGHSAQLQLLVCANCVGVHGWAQAHITAPTQTKCQLLNVLSVQFEKPIPG